MPPPTATVRPPRPDDPLVSFVVPVFNESSALDPFLATTGRVVADLGTTAEFVFVNDGSRDDTLTRLFALQADDDRIRIVNLSRNFGKEAALTAGLEASGGDVVVPIDVDLQDPPELLAEFLPHWRDGYDVVYGVRRSRSTDSLVKRVTAGAFYRVFNWLSPNPIPPNVGDFRLLDRRVVDALVAFPERTRFMKALFSWVGFPSIGVEFDRPPRSAGRSSWSLLKLWNFALDAIVGFTTLPLRIWTYVGLVISLGCVLYSLLIFGLAVTGGIDDVPGYASQLIVILFLGALQLISLGLIGEYVGRLLIETKRRPVYLLEGLYEPVPTTPPAPPTATEPQQTVPAGRVNRRNRPVPTAQAGS